MMLAARDQKCSEDDELRCRNRRPALRPPPQEIAMKKLIVALALGFVLATGTVTVLAVQPQPALADCSNGGC
jgi:hypothetical protein